MLKRLHKYLLWRKFDFALSQIFNIHRILTFRKTFLIELDDWLSFDLIKSGVIRQIVTEPFMVVNPDPYSSI